MGKPMTTTGLDVCVSDVSGQKQVRVSELPQDATVGEMIEGVLSQMKLPRNDASGHPLTYHARLEREGRHLHGSEMIGDSLQNGDQVVLQPNIDAGGYR